MFESRLQKNFYKPIHADYFYSYQIDLTLLNKHTNSNYVIYVLFTAINTNSRYAYAACWNDPLHFFFFLVLKLIWRVCVHGLAPGDQWKKKVLAR